MYKYMHLIIYSRKLYEYSFISTFEDFLNIFFSTSELCSNATFSDSFPSGTYQLEYGDNLHGLVMLVTHSESF